MWMHTNIISTQESLPLETLYGNQHSYMVNAPALDLFTYYQGRSKVFTTGQARFNPEHYVIKRVGGKLASLYS